MYAIGCVCVQLKLQKGKLMHKVKSEGILPESEVAWGGAAAGVLGCGSVCAGYVHRPGDRAVVKDLLLDIANHLPCGT